MIMVILWNFIETPLYKNLNLTIHHQWASLFDFAYEFKISNSYYNNASFNNYDSNNEKIHNITTNSIISNNLDA
jgi:hypothetical protein